MTASGGGRVNPMPDEHQPRHSRKEHPVTATPADAGEDRYWTVAETATRLRVSKMTVYRLAEAGAFPGTIRVVRAYRIPDSGLRAYLRANSIEAAP